MCPAEWRILPTRCTSEYTVRMYDLSSLPSRPPLFQDASARFRGESRLEFILEHPRFNPSAAKPPLPSSFRIVDPACGLLCAMPRLHAANNAVVKRSRNPRAIPLRAYAPRLPTRGPKRGEAGENARVYKYRRGPHMLHACVQCELTTTRGIPSRNKTATCASTCPSDSSHLLTAVAHGGNSLKWSAPH